LGAQIVLIKAYHMYSCLISMKVVILCVTVPLHYVLWSIMKRISNYGRALWKPVDWLKEEQACIST